MRNFRIENGWFSTDDTSIAASWYRPSTPSGRGVLIVRSIAHEDDAANPGICHVASELADSGVETLVIGLSGSGLSSGVLNVSAPQRWVDTTGDLAAAFASVCPAGLVVCGFRVGALVAAHAVANLGVSPRGVVLWQPYGSGRQFTRSLRIVAGSQRSSASSDVADGISIGSHRYTNEFLDALSLMAPLSLPEIPVLVAHGFGASASRKLVSSWGTGRVDEFDETENWVLSGGIDRSVAPTGTAERIAAFAVANTTPPANATIGASQDAFALERCLGRVVDGVRIRESFVECSNGLVGVLVEGVSNRSEEPAVLLLSSLGPGGKFVELSHERAIRGAVTLRIDLSGFGLSPPRSRRRPGLIYTTVSAEDVAAGAAQLEELGHENVVVVGFCAGGWAALRAPYHRPPVLVIAINVELYATGPIWMRSRIDGASMLARQRSLATARFLSVWRRLDPFVAARRWLRALTDRGTGVHLIYDMHDAGYLHWCSRVEPGLRTPSRSARVTVETFEDLGHLTEGRDGSEMFVSVARRLSSPLRDLDADGLVVVE